MNSSQKTCFLDIVKIVTQQNEAALDKMSHCLKHPENFYDDHLEKYEDRDLDLDEFDLDDPEFYWISMVDILEDAGYLIEIDWSSPLDEFIPMLQDIAEVKNYSVFANLPDLDDTLPSNEALSVMNDFLAEFGKILVCFDIDSDCYDLTLIEQSEYNSLKQACDLLGTRIYHEFK